MPFSRPCVRSAVMAIAMVSLLGGCGRATEAPAGKAGGAQVLPGTISDAMIDTDRSQAQPLLQPPPVRHGNAIDAATADASDAPVDAAAPAADPAKPAPAVD